MASPLCERRTHQQLFNTLSPGDQARVRSCAGPHSARWLTAIPTEAALQLPCPLFRYATCRRLGLAVTYLTEYCEGCQRLLDPLGNHRATCMRSGRVQRRHRPLVAVWRKIFHEAGVPIPDRNVERTLRTNSYCFHSTTTTKGETCNLKQINAHTKSALPMQWVSATHGKACSSSQ